MPPTFSTAFVNGTTLKLTFNEPLGAAASLTNDPFTVKKTPRGGSEETVSLSGSPAISGATVTLTLANAVLGTDTDVKVSYAKPTAGTGNRLVDAAGNEVVSFSDEPVTNVTGDTTPPTLVRGELDGGAVTLYFSEALDPASTGGIFRAYVVHNNNGSLSFTLKGEVSISGNAVTVGFGTTWLAKAGVPNNTAHYKVPISDPPADSLRDLAGNPVRTPYERSGIWLRTRNVTLDNLTGLGPATVTGVAVSSDAGADRTYAQGETIRVRLTFSKAVTVTGTPRVKIDLGTGTGDEKWADFEKGSGTATLDFAYEVAEGDSSTAGIAVLANTLELDGGTIESASNAGQNATLAHAGLAHDTAHKVDGKVAVSDVAVSSDAGDDDTYARGEKIRVTLTFSDAVNVTGTPRVKLDLGSGAEPWADYERGDGTNTLVFAYTVAEGDSSAAGIAVLANTLELNGGTIKSTTGARASAKLAHAGLGHDPAHKVDTAPPTLSAKSVDGAKLTLTFNEPLGAAALLTNDPFTVKKTPPRGSEQNVSLSGSPTISGATVTLTLANKVLSADTGVKVSYTGPTSGTDNRLRDAAGNETESFTDESVTNRTRAVVSGVAVSSDAGTDATYGLGDTIEVRLTFSEAVEVTGTPRLKLDLDPAAWGERWAVYESGDGTTMLEFSYEVAERDFSTLGVAVPANTLELNGGTIRPVASSKAAALAHAGLAHDATHKVDSTPPDTAPRLSAARVKATTLTLTFDEPLSAAASLTNDPFTVKKTPQGGSEQDVSLSGSPAIDGAAVTLTLASAVLGTDTDVKVSYTKPTLGTGNRLVDAAGNEVVSFSDEPVTNVTGDTTAPTLERGEIDGGTMTLYFSEALDPDSTGGRFGLQVQYASNSLSNIYATGGVAISGNVVTVGLGDGNPRAIAGGIHNLFWEYSPPTDSTARGLRDLAGNEVRETRAIGLDNVTGPPTVTGVAVSSDAGVDRTYARGETIRVRLTFSKAVNVTGTPRVKLDLGSGTGDERWADYERGNGTKMLVFAYEVKSGDASSAGVAVLANTLELDGGTIKSTTGARASAKLAHSGLAHDPAHKVEATPPTLSGASVEGATLKLAFDEPLGAAASLTNNPFTVKKTPQGGSEQTESLSGSPAIDGATVTLTLASAVLETDTGVKVSYAKPTTGDRLVDAAGNEVASFSDEAVTYGGAPVLTALALDADDGGRLTLTFDQYLTAPTAKQLLKLRHLFEIQGARYQGAPVTMQYPSAVAVSGRTVTLALGAEVLPGHAATVSYLLSGPALADLHGNQVAAFRGRTAARPAGGAAIPPSLTAAQVADTALTLTFDRALDASSAPAGRRFEVRHRTISRGTLGPNRISRGTGTATVSGQTVTVTLAAAVPHDALAQLYYLKGDDANPLRGASNGPVAVDILGFLNVTMPDRMAPELVQGVVAGDKLTLYYDEALDSGSRPAAGDYTVTAGSAAQTVSGVAMSASAVTLTLSASIAAGTAVTVDYTAGSNPVRDVAGNDAENLSGEAATNHGPANAAAPALAATDPAVVDSGTLTLAWTLPLDPSRVPDTSAFTVTGDNQSVESVAVRGDTVELGLRWRVLPCSTPTVSYTKPSANALRSVWGVDAAGFTGQAVTDAAGGCVSGWLANARRGSVILRGKRPFATDAAPRTEWFAVAATGGPVTVTGAAFSAEDPRELKLSVSRAFAADETVTVSYRRPRGAVGLWDVDGNQLAGVTDMPVAHGSVAATGVAVVSDPGDDATYAAGDAVKVQVTFSEAVDVDTEDGTPRLKLDLGGDDGAGERQAAYEEGSGTTTLTFAWQAAAPDEAAAGVAVLANTLELNGGTIASVATQEDAALGHAGLDPDPAHKVDAAPPRLLRGEIDGGTVTLHFSEALDPASTGGRFLVDVASGTPTTLYAGFWAAGPVSVAGATVTVGVGEGNPRAHVGRLVGNRVLYARRADGGGGALRDLAGNPVVAPTVLPYGEVETWRGSEEWRFVKIDLVNVTGGAPRVMGVAVVSDAGADRTYGGGDGIEVRVTFDRAVDVTGTPRLKIDMDPAHWGEKQASYESGSGTSSLTFVHTVAEPNISTRGIAVLANTLELDGGTIRAGGADALLAHAGLGHDANHKVDWRTAGEESDPAGTDTPGGWRKLTPPTVTGVSVVSSPASGDTYLLGETIRFRATFDRAVTVTGSPRLSIDMDPAKWGTKQAAYEKGSGTTSLDFVHTVVEPNYSTQGIAVLANTLALNGGTVKASGDETDAELGHTGLGHDSGHKVDWRPSISVADASANEGAGAKVAFEVSLSRAFATSGHRVTVDYATADGTAKAGEDYTATSGTLTFAAGEKTKTVNVPVLDDAVDEGEETFGLRLSNVQGARAGDLEATGTIANDDPLQTMWLSRFGRTVADHVTGAVSDRLANPLSGAQVTVGGQSVDLAQTEDGAALTQALTGLARAFGASEQAAPGDGFGSDVGQSGSGTGPGVGTSPALGSSTPRDLSGRELLLGSAFHLAHDGDGTGPGLAAWGRVTTGGFDGEERADGGSVRIDGEATTGILGADAAWNRLLAGVAISVSEGEGTFGQSGVDSGSIESTMTTVSPYARLAVTDRLSVWGLAGWGTGDMTITQAANENQPERVTRTDLEMRLAALGGRGALMQADETGGFDLGLRADAFWVETEAQAVSNEGGTTAVASRVRLALEGSRAFRMAGGTLTPGVELGVRHDGGDAETGTGVELGGSVTWTDPKTGLGVEARVRTLVAHEDSDYREWGASGAVRLSPGERGRGLSFSLSPTWGAASSGVERLWGARDARGLAPGAGSGAGSGHEFEAGQRLEGELGYGLGLFGERFTGTPNVGFGLSDGARDYRIGWRLDSAVRGDPGFEVNLDATRREATNDDEPAEHEAMLRGSIRW